MKKKATALRFIQQGVSKAIYPTIFGVKKAKDAWEILKISSLELQRLESN